MPRRSMICVLLFTAGACYPGSAGAPSDSERGPSRENRASGSSAPTSSTIDAVELQQVAGSNLYDAINQLRPGFFASRNGTSLLNEPGDEILVVLDRHVLGGVSELRGIATKITKSVRRLSAADVFQITGRMAPSGGVEVVLGR